MDTNISPETPTTSTSSNIVEKAIKIIALVVYACGLIVGIAAGDETGRFLIPLLYWVAAALSGTMMLGFLITLLYWVAAALSGTMMLGFSEVIRLLHEINSKIK